MNRNLKTFSNYVFNNYGTKTILGKSTFGLNSLNSNSVLHNIIIYPPYQRNGLGTTLLRNTENLITKHYPYVETIQLYAWQSYQYNVSDFFIKNGYQFDTSKAVFTYDDQDIIYELYPMIKNL